VIVGQFACVPHTQLQTDLTVSNGRSRLVLRRLFFLSRALLRDGVVSSPVICIHFKTPIFLHIT
jgi:hypothetical protein